MPPAFRCKDGVGMRIIRYDLEMDEDFCNRLVEADSCEYASGYVTKPHEVADMLNVLYGLGRRSEEYVYAVALNAKGRVLGVFEVSHGTLDAAACRPREIFIRALLCGAASVVTAHNHPSQLLEPSASDRKACRKMKEAGELLGVPLCDNIILSNSEYFSFLEEGFL